MKVYKSLFGVLLNYLSEELECSAEDILLSKKEDCVSARIVLTQCMSEAGLTDNEIADVTGFTQQLISRNKALFDVLFNQSRTIRLLTILTRKFIQELIESYKKSVA